VLTERCGIPTPGPAGGWRPQAAPNRGHARTLYIRMDLGDYALARL